jgi:acyl-CoA reductase-like NAD-dependent aldehyde dehydrogenase
VAQEEIFGPVLTVTPYDTDDEAVAIANNTIYGLSGEVSSADVDRAFEVAKRMRTGDVTINGKSHFGIGSPFGRTKQSGLGYRKRGNLSYCGGYYHHELVRRPGGWWRSRHLREENVWFVNSPTGAPELHM